MKRRDFLKTGLTGAAAFTLSGLTALPPRSANAATLDVNLVAEGSFRTLADGTSIFTWQFNNLNGTGPGALASGLVTREGDTVNVTVTNNLDRSINFVIPGVLPNSPAVTPGGSRTYSFNAPAAGSYLYTDGVNGEIGRVMGLAGPLIVMPADGSNSLYSSGPSFDRQYTLVMSELDDRLNTAIYNGQPYSMNDYEPNYFFANGLSYPATSTDADTSVVMGVGEDVAIRFINTGAIVYPMHFHGYHVRVASRNRVPETGVIDKDTVMVDVNECVDVILPVTQPGVFPLHTHYVPGVTANGDYPNGGLIMMSAV